MSIQVRNLVKKYGGFTAVNDLSFDVPEGALFAFLGENGAGKSTTIGCITTTLSPTSGTVRVCDRDVLADSNEVRRNIGVVFQQSLLDPLLSVRENLTTRARFYGLERREAARRLSELSEMVGLEEILDRRYGVLSGGQKRRADIARALVHQPRVIVLDEPTAGLDPQSREHIWAAIARLRSEHSTTVFLTTHYMEETDRADQVCIIARGEVVAQGTPAELRSTHSNSVLTVRAADTASLLSVCDERGLTTEAVGDTIRIPVDGVDEAKAVLLLPGITDFEFRHGTMDDVFLSVTKERAA